MAHVITQSCCNDAACTLVCPVDCIQPAPGTAGFARAEMLFIDPSTCIDCGVCVTECPVDAIAHEADLHPDQAHFRDLNAAFFTGHTKRPLPERVVPEQRKLDSERPLRIAVVGSGPAGMYAATELLDVAGAGVEVDVYDRLLTPWGLVRHGVAPDHPATKQISTLFASRGGDARLRFWLGVEVGRDVTASELSSAYDAVVYAVGADGARPLLVPGENRNGCHPAPDFVAWYNGHPDAANFDIDLHGTRAAIIGNGNVALDVARILTSDPSTLAGTDIADRAVEALLTSRIREVIVLGRRGPLQAAFTTAELMALEHLDGVAVVVRPEDLVLPPAEYALLEASATSAARYETLQRLARRPTPSRNERTIELRFYVEPTAFHGEDKVTSVTLSHTRMRYPDATVEPTGRKSLLHTDLVITSIGYRTTPLPGVPHDPRQEHVRNEAGRVVHEDGTVVPGAYVVGWAKRGPSGVIGTNKHCSAQTIALLLDDAQAGRLPCPAVDRRAWNTMIALRCPHATDWSGWRRIDRAETQSEAPSRRPRRKLTTWNELHAVAHGDSR